LEEFFVGAFGPFAFDAYFAAEADDYGVVLRGFVPAIVLCMNEL